VAISALGYGFVFVGVTGHTGHIVVLGFCGKQHIVNTIVTSRTEKVRGAVRIMEHQRLVNFVTGCAVGLSHIFRVRFMTLDTLRDDAVLVRVAEVAGEGSVLTRVGDQLFILRGMAGQTFSFQLTGQLDLQGLVRVVATQAIFQLIMFGILVAHTALGDIVGAGRPVAGMTFQAVDCLFVRAARLFNFFWLQLMAFGTVINSQYRLGRNTADGDQQGTDNHGEQGGQSDVLLHFAS